MLVLVISSFAFGVIGVVFVVVWLLSLSIVCLCLLVKSMLFFKQIQVCNVGSEFVHGWRICLLGVGRVIRWIRPVQFRGFMLSMALILLVF